VLRRRARDGRDWKCAGGADDGKESGGVSPVMCGTWGSDRECVRRETSGGSELSGAAAAEVMR